MFLPADNQRIKEVIELYCDGNELLFSKEIGISQPRINRLFNKDPRSGRYPAPSFEIVQAIINKFVDVNPRWLLTGTGDPVVATNPSCDPGSPDNGETMNTDNSRLLVSQKDDSRAIRVPVVDISVAAGSGCYNEDWPEELDYIRMPGNMMHNGETYLCVRIKGVSMAPTLLDGGYLVIRLLDRSQWADVREGHIYVVAEKEGRAFVKRIKNRLHDHGFLVCMSDNPDVMRFPNFNLMEDEINTLWHAEWYISAKMPDIHNTYYSKVSELEDGFESLKDSIQTMKDSIRKELRAEIRTVVRSELPANPPVQ